MVSNDLLVSMRSLHLSQCVLLKPAIGEIISSIKLTESMVLAVDEILHLYTGLCGAMQWSCLLNTGAIFTWRQFLHLAKRRRVHHCAQVPVVFKVWWSRWDHIEWGCERAVVPQNQGCCDVLSQASHSLQRQCLLDLHSLIWLRMRVCRIKWTIVCIFICWNQTNVTVRWSH